MLAAELVYAWCVGAWIGWSGHQECNKSPAVERGCGSGFGSGRKASLSRMQKTGMLVAVWLGLVPRELVSTFGSLLGPRALPRVVGECHVEVRN